MLIAPEGDGLLDHVAARRVLGPRCALADDAQALGHHDGRSNLTELGNALQRSHSLYLGDVTEPKPRSALPCA